MKLLFGKLFLYTILIFISLEILTRILHLYQEQPVFIINDSNVKTYAPNQKGNYVVGNRRMNFSEYRINKSGFNSYREFIPTKDKIEIAIIGDSFIEGLHQNYYNSIGKKVENKLNNKIKVFEYGHSGYDFADQLHLMSAYKEQFDLIDYNIIYLKFDNDLLRDSYKPDQYWIDSQYFLSSRIGKKVKLLEYLNSIGAFEALRDIKRQLLSIVRNNKNSQEKTTTNNKNLEAKRTKYLNNFKKITKTYGFDKTKTVFLLDSRSTSKPFLDYCDLMNYKYIDFGKAFEESKTPTTLIYDMHWNNNGRSIIASAIAEYISKQN